MLNPIHVCFQINQAIIATRTFFLDGKNNHKKKNLDQKYGEIPPNCYLQVGTTFVFLAVPVSQEGRLQ